MPNRGLLNSVIWRGSAGVVLTAAAIVVGGSLSCAAQTDNADISIRRASERTSFSDDEIKDGFFKTAFHAELQFDRRVERIRKFDEPVRVFVVNRGAPDRRAEIAIIIADIRAHVDHLDLAMTDDRQAANFVVTLVQSRDLVRTIRARYGPDKAKQIQQSLHPQCLSGIGKDQSFCIRRAEAILPVDAGEFAFYAAPMKNCCKRWVSSTMTIRCPGPCSMMTSKWDSSMFTISTFSIRTYRYGCAASHVAFAL